MTQLADKCGSEDQMKLDRILNFIAVAAIATSFSFLVSPVEVTAIASDNSRTIETMLDETPIFRFRRETNHKNRGFLSLLADYISQTRDDTMRAFNEVSDLVSRQIVPAKQLNQSAPASVMELSDNATTTAAPYILTQEEFLRILRRNLRGLARLFNMESRKAIDASNNNVRILRKDFVDAVRPYFVRNSTT